MRTGEFQHGQEHGCGLYTVGFVCVCIRNTIHVVCAVCIYAYYILIVGVMYVCMYIYIHTYIGIAYIQQVFCLCMGIVGVYFRKHPHPHTHTHIYIYMYTYIHTCTHKHVHM
jgi:hypothetical protein